MRDRAFAGRGSVCLPNIGAAEQRKRLIFGAVALAVSLGASLALTIADAARGWRLALFPLLFGAAIGYFQAREKT